MKRRKNDEDRNRDGEVATSGSTVAPASVSLPLLVDGASRPKLGQVLVDQQLLSPEALTAALDLQAASGRRLGSVLVESGLVGAHVLNDALAAQFQKRTPPSDFLADRERQYNLFPYPDLWRAWL